MKWVHAKACPETPTKSAAKKAKEYANSVIVLDDDEDDGDNDILGKRKYDGDEA